MIFDVAAVASSFPNPLTCGENARLSPQIRDLYYTMKDARNAARSEERAVVPGEPIRLAAGWYEVARLGLEILGRHSKDIEVLAWSAEAQLRINNFAGLRDVFTAMESLFREHWEELHSIGDGDLDDKVAPLAGLNGISSEGTLIQPIRLAPLVPNAGFAQFSLWEYQHVQRTGEEARRDALNDAVGEAGAAAMRDHHRTAADCVMAFDRVVVVLTERCGDAAPPSSNTRNVLAEAAAAVRILAGSDANETEPSAASVSPEAGVSRSASEASTVVLAGGALSFNSREDALEALMAVARYFKRTEPHSPTATSLETLVRRGRMNFADLLGELLPDATVRGQVLAAAGIQPSKGDTETRSS